MLKKLKGLEYKHKKEVQISVQIQDEIKNIQIAMDCFELSNVVSNLINNSYRAVREGGLINIEIGLIDDFVKVAVSDNGPGIPLGLLYKLGQQPLDKSEAIGEGVGIYNASKTLERAGGKMVVATKRHHGSTFICYIPYQK